MKLRARLAVATFAVAAPQLVGLAAWDNHSRREAAEEGLTGLLPTYFDATHRAACLGDPVHFGAGLAPPPGPAPGELPGVPQIRPDRPHGRMPTLWAYGLDGSRSRPDAPTIPPGLAAQVLPFLIGPVDTPWYRPEVAVATRTGWGGPCEILVLEGSTAAGWLGAILPASPVWLVPLLGGLVGVLLAAGSAVERVRRLTRAVRAAAAGGYQETIPVEGSDEVAELARAFDAAGQAVRHQLAETRSREVALREFLANTTHDVLLPLTVLRGHLSSLRAQLDAGGAERATLLSAMDEAHYLGSLVHNLAAVAHLDAAEHALERHPVDLCALVERVVARHRPIARQREIEVNSAVPDVPPAVTGDVTLLEQAVNNLVYNAVRYNREGGHVALVLAVTGARFSLRVFDDGPGVSPDVLARLSERGFRASEARSRSPEGKGLGLAIAQRVADAHGFTLGFRRSEHGGLEAELAGGWSAPLR